MSADLAIRPAVESDVPEMAAIYMEGWHDSARGLLPEEVIALRTIEYRINYLSQRCRQAGTLQPIVGTISGVIVAIGCPSATAELGEIEHVYVAQTARKQGIGAMMISQMLDMFGRQHIDRAVLWSFEGNEQANSFYQHTGWEPTGRRKLEPIDETDQFLPVIEFTRDLEK